MPEKKYILAPSYFLFIFSVDFGDGQQILMCKFLNFIYL